MRIEKVSLSAVQKLQFATIRELPEIEKYILVSFPDDCSLEVNGSNIMVRKK